MTSPRDVFSFLCTAIVVVLHCEADHRLPAPRNLSYKWIDPFTVNFSWSWEKPDGLPDGCEVSYEIHLWDFETHRETKQQVLRTTSSHHSHSYLTEEMGSDHWEFTIQTLGLKSCDGWIRSEAESRTVFTQKPSAKVVQDFKCLILQSGELNCSWIPVNPSLDLTLSYRFCGTSEENIKSSKTCDQLYSSGTRSGCHLETDAVNRAICVHVETEAGLNTFKPKLVIPVQHMSIKEDGNHLNLTWTPPDVGNCGWEYELCYTECKKDKPCQIFSPNKDTKQHGPMRIPYDRNCRYEFKSNVRTNKYCLAVFSGGSDVVTYGVDKPPDGTLTVIAIVIPIILSVCVILSCYCFRRHSAIICPIIPDPSAIFKEMIMNGNKEMKPTPGSLYTPVPEPIEHCKITLPPENGAPQENS